ncbi:YciI family protein [Kribbella sp. NPDC051770]|uniref:YciI family protein n=1 Tax=Kribbella sp. NPDC051770 TaxID=3155413 RepID=UPI003448B9A7
MEYFVYGRDRAGAFALKVALTEEHWAFMDAYAGALIARGPTLAADDEDAETTGSLHILDVPDAAAAARFAYDEPYFLGGVFDEVLVRRFDRRVGTTMWDFASAVPGWTRYLLLALDGVERELPESHVIMAGALLDDDGKPVGQAALVEAPSADEAAELLPGAEVHVWRFGGRPSDN